MGMDSVVALCIAGGLFVAFGIAPVVAGEIRYRRAMKAEAKREQAERERQALVAQQMKVTAAMMFRQSLLDIFETPMLDLAAHDSLPPEPAPSSQPPTLDVLAATAQQNPERWKDFLDV